MTGAFSPAERQRGAPLLALILLVGGWIALRVALWHLPFVGPVPIKPAPAYAPPAIAKRASEAGHVAGNVASGRQRPPHVTGPTDAPVSAPLPSPWLPAEADPGASWPAVSEPVPPRQAVGQQLLLVAAFAHMELPAELAAYFVPDQQGSPIRPALARASAVRTGPSAPWAASAARWTGDAWLLLRNGSGGPIAAGEPSYGRSQAGAVLRYRLAPLSGHRPQAYVRATRALSGARESEAAVGLAARPVAGLPLRVAAEVRLSEGAAGREVRPAAYAVTELPPAGMPRGLRAEAYAQAGYVGGRYATAFVDGQARIDAPVARFGQEAELRAGGGVWGGVQKGAGRLDLGPSAAMKFRLGDTQSRVALDYRVRVAGDAAPKSGPALTISAGF
jgi:hypothetical protein